MRSNRLMIIVLGFVCFSHLLYMYSNASMFRDEYERQSVSQIRELGKVIQKEIEYALGFGIPVSSLGGMEPFLTSILDDTQELAGIEVKEGDRVLYEAHRDGAQAGKTIEVPVLSDGSPVARICLGMGGDLGKRTAALLFDLMTIVIAGLIVTYEIIRFFSSKLVIVPFKQTLLTFNTMVLSMNPYHITAVPEEFHPFFKRIRDLVIVRIRQIASVRGDLNGMARIFLSKVFYGRQAFFKEVNRQHAVLDGMMDLRKVPRKIVDPSQIRPVVFLFFLGANLQASFLPLFSKELLETPTFLTGIFSPEILMALPITCYMFTVFFFMLFMGSNLFKSLVRMDYAIGLGTLCTAAGLVICGFATDIVQLIGGRMLGAVGFSFIVIYTKQFIIEHSREKDRAMHLAGFTAAFSGGLFCSVIIGSILVEYFSYQFVFFCAAAIVLLIYVFDYMILADKVAAGEQAAGGDGDLGLVEFFRHGIKDVNLICILVHGIFTRITFIGFFYYSVPIFLRPDFVFADIGRIMMFYSIPSVLFAGALNRQIRQVRQSKISVVGSNILVGAVLLLFSLLGSGPVWSKAVFVILSLLVLGVSNSITFPAQASLLIETRTAKAIGNRTALSVYSSFERIGSSLGPVFFGFFASIYGITTAIVMGGALCIAGNLIFLIFYNPKSLT